VPRGSDAGRQATGFVVKLVVLTLLVGLGESQLHKMGWGHQFQSTVARVSSRLAGLVSDRVTLDGNKIKGGLPLQVTIECTALYATGLFLAAVIAFPCPWRARLVGFVVGVVGVAAINIVRIAGLVLISIWNAKWFDFAHIVLMQGFLISCVAPLWLAWAMIVPKWFSRRRPG